MNVSTHLRLLDDAELRLGEGTVAEGHQIEPDVYWLCQRLAGQCDNHRSALALSFERYGKAQEPERLETTLLSEARSGPVGLLRDLQDAYTLASFVSITWTLVEQAASALRDRDLLHIVESCSSEADTQIACLRTRMKNAVPQALVAAQ